jgi:hypothetical protein
LHSHKDLEDFEDKVSRRAGSSSFVELQYHPKLVRVPALRTASSHILILEWQQQMLPAYNFNTMDSNSVLLSIIAPDIIVTGLILGNNL